MTKGTAGSDLRGQDKPRTTIGYRATGARAPAALLVLLAGLVALLSLPSGCGGGSGGSDASNGGESGSAVDCNDGKACTIDVVVDGRCTHAIGPNSGNTACPEGQYCTVERGCAKAPVCATDNDCEDAWTGDACKTDARCDAASSICLFELLDKDLDGHAPQACGGGDCNDSALGISPSARETCNGVDDDCDGTVDEEDDAPCGASSRCVDGECTCAAERQCDGVCVDLETSVLDCGSCDTACPDGADCVSGKCECRSDEVLCMTEVGGKTTSRCSGLADRDNCGECGVVCGEKEICVEGVCKRKCVNSELVCADGEICVTAPSRADACRPDSCAGSDYPTCSAACDVCPSGFPNCTAQGPTTIYCGP